MAAKVRIFIYFQAKKRRGDKREQNVKMDVI